VSHRLHLAVPLLFLAGLGTIRAAPAFVVGSGFIFESAPFPSCHASTLAETSPGRLVVAWFGGTHEKHPDVGIWISRSHAGLWTAPVEVANGVQSATERFPCWNPVLVQAPGGPTLLFYRVGPSPNSWWGMLLSSSDSGATWGTPRRLPDGILGPIKNKPVFLPGGDLLCPSSTEDHGWHLHFERTADLGRTWTATPPLAAEGTIGAIQPSVLLLPGGRLAAVARTRNGRLCQTRSLDGGRSWSPLALTEVPNPNSGLDAVTLAGGRHLLVYNATAKGRSPLNLALSADASSWEPLAELENEPGAEFSYPAVIQTDDRLVHVTYTWKRTRIKHVVLDPALFPRKAGVPGVEAK